MRINIKNKTMKNISMEENELSFLYKIVIISRCPARLIIVRDILLDEDIENFTIFKNKIYESSFDAMRRMVLQNYTQREIIDFFKSNLTNYTEEDIIMIYFETIKTIYEKFLEIIQEYNESDENKIKIIKRIIDDSYMTENNYESLSERIYNFDLFIRKKNNIQDSIQLRIKNEVNIFDHTIRNMQNEQFEATPTFNSYQSIVIDFNKWYFITKEDKFKDCIQIELFQDIKKREEVRLRNEYMSKIKAENSEIYITETEIKSATFIYKPTNLNGESVRKDEGYDIFDNAIVSEYIPYIKYVNSFGKTYYKLFKGVSVTEIPDYKTIMVESTGENVPNTIVASLWLGDFKDKTMKMYEAPKDTFFKIVYRIGDNKKSGNVMKIETTLNGVISKNINYAIDRVRNAFPSLIIPNENIEDKVRCEFSMYNVSFDEKTLYHLIQNNKPYKYFFTTLENTEQYAHRKNIQIEYYQEKILDENKKPNVRFNLNQKTTSTEHVPNVYTDNEKILKTKKFEAGTDYIRVSVIKSRSRNILPSFIETLKTILLKYKNKDKAKMEEFYNNSLPNLQVNEENKEIKEKQLIQKLKEAAPEMFVGGYARLCPPKRQPLIINIKEKGKWEKKGLKPRLFPKENPYLFVCPRDPNTKSAIHLGVQRNRTSKNKNDFQFLPCCFNNPTDTKTGSYTRYMDGNYSSSPASKGTMLISNPSILLPTVPSYIPSVKIFDLISSTGIKEIYRRGSIFSKNSFLHCVCDAIDPEYENAKDKEKYVIKLRNEMADNLHPSLLKQELYEYDENEIRTLLKREDIFFDPVYYYRAVEETFNVNVFIFGINYPDTKAKSKDKGYIQIPNFKLMYCRNYKPERTNILILRNWGTTANDLEIPQCELLVHYDFKNKLIYKTFDESIGNLCNLSIENSLQTYNCVFNREDYSSEKGKVDMPISVYKNVFSLDHFKIFSGIPVSQYIDPYGKMRAVNFKVDDKYITICVIPSQPENLPSETKIYKTTYNFAIKYFGMEPSYYSTNINGDVDGLWFSILGLEQAEYIPIEPIKKSKLKNIQEGEKYYIISENTEVTTRLRKLRKTLNIIVELSRWVFEIFNRSWKNGEYEKRIEKKKKQLIKEENDEELEFFVKSNVVDVFMQWFTVSINDGVVNDSANFYNVSKIGHKLPNVKNVDEAFNYIYNNTNNLVYKYENGEMGFIFYNDTFSEKIKNNIWYKNTTGVPRVIANYYQDETDFKKYPKNIVFTSEEDLYYWLDTIKNGSKNFNILYKINEQIESSDWERKDPFLLKDAVGKLYIVQNNENNSLEKALKICEEWSKNTLNLGYNTLEKIEKKPDYILYTLDQFGKLYPVEVSIGEDNLNNEVDFDDPELKISQIFYYNEKKSKTGTKKYASLLPLL